MVMQSPSSILVAPSRQMQNQFTSSQSRLNMGQQNSQTFGTVNKMRMSQSTMGQNPLRGFSNIPLFVELGY
jgi:hypothetical protein